MKSKETHDDKYTIPSLMSAGDILRYLSSYRVRKATLTEITKKLGINKSTCYRILQTLVNMRMVIYDPDTKTFSLGPYLIVLGKRAEEFLDYMPIVKEYLKEIVSITGSTCALVQRLENEWFYLAKEEPNASFRVTINVGQRFKLTSGSTGKLFLAYMNYDERQKIINNLGITKHTEKTIVDVEEFNKELLKIREQGYATSIEEHYLGIDGVAAPIIDSLGEVKMALTCILLHREHSEEQIKQIGEMLKVKTEEISKKIYS